MVRRWDISVRVSRTSGYFVIALAFVVLLGWALHLPGVTAIHAGWATMKANTAIGFLLAGGALLCLARDGPRRILAGRTLAALCACVGGLVLAEYAFSVDLGIDQLLVQDAADSSRFPGRPSPITALDFLLIGASMLGSKQPGRWPHRLSPLLAGFVAASAFLAIVGYLYSIPSLYTISGYASVALPTALAFAVVALASLQLDPRRGLGRLIYGEHAGSFAARRLLPVAIVMPVLIGWLRLKGQELELYDTAGGATLLVTSLVGVLVIVILWLSVSLERVDRERIRLANVEQLLGELRELHQRLGTLIEISPLAIIEVDRDLRVVAWNPAAERLFGWRADEVVGRTLPTVSEPQLSEMKQLVAANEPYLREGPVETQRRTKDGRLIDVSLWTAPRLDEHGAVVGSIGMVADLGRLKRAEQQFRSLFESAPDALVLADGQGRILRANATTERLLGYRPDELSGRPVEALMPERFRTAHVGHRSQYGQAPQVRPMGMGLALYGLHKDGREIPIEISLSPIEAEDGLLVVASIRDISARKRVEEQLMHLQRLQAVGQLTGGIAHEFNNLMAVMLGNAEHLVQELHDRPALKAIAGRIANAVERGAQLTGDLLSFSRKQMLQPRLLDPGEVLRHMERFIRPSLGERHQLRIDLDSDAWRLVADPAQLDNALVNLIINARDAMGHGGAIRLEVHNAMIDAKGAKHLDVPEGRYVLFEVADTGTGMTPEVLRQAAEPFFTTKEVGKGTGLGLSMVHGFAKQSGGALEIQSEIGLGTKVRIYLPAAIDETATVARPQAQQREPQKELTVLLVEDDPLVLVTTADILRAAGHRVITADNGPEALEILQAVGRIDVLLTDVILPKGLSGFDLAREVLSRQPRAKVIYASGYSDSEIAQAHDTEEAYTLLRKPYTSTQLGDALKKVAG